MSKIPLDSKLLISNVACGFSSGYVALEDLQPYRTGDTSQTHYCQQRPGRAEPHPLNEFRYHYYANASRIIYNFIIV